MSRPVLKVGDYTPEQIKGMFRDDERYTIGIRLYAVYQVSLGQSSRNLEELYNTSFKQITNWVHRFERDGIDGLRDKQGRGRHAQLDEKQRRQIAVVLSEDPEKYGYNSATWTGPMLIEWIAKHYGIVYKKAQIYNIIKSLGFTFQKGRGIFPETDEVAQQSFKAALKKLLEEYPDAVLLYEDECSMSNTATIGYQWSQKGKQPQVKCKQRKRERQTVFGSYNYGTGQIKR